MNRQRLDKALVDRDLARSRSHAKNLIEDERVLVDGFPAEKASTLVEHDDHLEIEGDEYPWVGRGGKKIWPFLEDDWIGVEDRVAVDVGASTGGFTQGLLRAGARLVWAVDVGYGQLDYQLREDERVRVHDRYNFRHADPSDFTPTPDRFTMDVSFISTCKLLDSLNNVTEQSSEGLVLVKPQFEANPEDNDEGIVTDPSVRERVLREVMAEWGERGWGTEAIAPAPLTGQEGNQEFIVKFVRGSSIRPEEPVTRVVHDEISWYDQQLQPSPGRSD